MRNPARRPRRRIICVGNRLVPSDDTGPRVYDRLAAGPLPEGIEIVDGGLQGLDLFPLVEETERVVFVDTLAGWGAPGEVVALSGEDFLEPSDASYGHGNGLAYLLKALPVLLEDGGPEIVLLGAEGPASEETVEKIARRSLAAVSSDGDLAGSGACPR
jgi:hydrogenase maturation protease